MFSLRQMDVDDKVCEQVDMALFEEIYPKEGIEQCVEQSASWMQKKRRRRQTNPFTLVWLLIGMGLWSRSNQSQVWKKLVGKLRYLHPKRGQGKLSDSGISRRRRDLGSSCFRTIMKRYCHVLAHRATMPMAFFGRYRLMAIDGTLFKTPDTEANALTFGRSHNQHSKGGYPLVRCVLLSECGSHAVVGLDICDYLTSEQHGAHRLLDQIGPNQLITMDAGITSAGFLERVRSQRAHALGQLEVGVWEHPRAHHRLSDGSSIIRLYPTDTKKTKYPLHQSMWVRIIRYRLTDERLGEKGKVYRLVTTLLNPVTAPALALIGLYHERWEVELVIDEIKTHERAQRRVLRSKAPDGVVQELYGIFLAHYLVRALMAQAAVQAELDPDRLSFTEGLFEVCEIMDFTVLLEPEGVPSLLMCLYDNLREKILPPRLLRINPREVKQTYNKWTSKKDNRPPSKPFEPYEQFLDFVELFDFPVPQRTDRERSLK
jgi:hypothetical protein